MKLQEKKILEECIQEIETGNLEVCTSNSLTNCHKDGLYSIWLAPTIRCFLTEGNLENWTDFDMQKPHINNKDFLLHDHRYDLTSIPLFGKQDNILYKETDKITPENEYDHYLFYSAFFQEDKIPKVEFKKKVGLKMIKYEEDETWFLQKEEIHRVIWKGPIVALLKEHRDPKFINMNPTNGYLVNHAKGKLPCEKGLYQPLNKEKCQNMIEKIYHLSKKRLKFLKL